MFETCLLVADGTAEAPITFTALIFTELIMVAVEVKRWHPLMLLAQVLHPLPVGAHAPLLVLQETAFSSLDKSSKRELLFMSRLEFKTRWLVAAEHDVRHNGTDGDATLDVMIEWKGGEDKVRPPQPKKVLGSVPEFYPWADEADEGAETRA